jgi:hypothetical protein
MKTTLQAPCAVHLGLDPEAMIDVAGHQFNAKEFMAIKRMNNLLSTELGLLCRVNPIEHHDALLLVVNTVVSRLLTRIPRATVSKAICEAYSDFRSYDAYYASSPHKHLGRAEIDRSFPVGLYSIATPTQQVLTNIILPVLNDDDTLDGLWLLLREALTSWLTMTLIRPIEEVEAMCGLPPEVIQEDNIIQFGKPSVDVAFDPFQAR